MELKPFDLCHIIYMIIAFPITVGLVVFATKCLKSEKAKALFVKISGAVMLFVILLNRALAMIYLNEPWYLPHSFCGTLALVLGVCTIICKKDSMPLHFLSYSAIVSGLVTTIYPNYLHEGSTIFFPPTLTSLIHHSLSFYLALLLFTLGYVKPNVKKWHAWPIGYLICLAYGVFNVKIVKLEDSMCINEPIIEGTFLNWFYLGLMFIATYTLFLFIFDAVKNKNNCLI